MSRRRDRFCKACNVQIFPDTKGQRYCDSCRETKGICVCGMKKDYAAEQCKSCSSKQPKECLFCGEIFIAGPKALYCSKLCRGRGYTLVADWGSCDCGKKLRKNGAKQCKDCRSLAGKPHWINKWTREDRAAAVYLQDGVCAIRGCFNPATHADHDHLTGEPRALLCASCNLAFGQLGEDVSRIQGLLEYAVQCLNAKRSIGFTDFTWMEEISNG